MTAEWPDEVGDRALDEAIRRAQEIVTLYIPKDVSLVDELIAERRAAADLE